MQSGKKNTVDAKEKAYRFALRIIKFIPLIEKSDAGKVVRNQIVRSGTSIGANLIEAKASSTLLEYKKYFEIALKSGNETLYWISIIKDAKLSSEKVELEILQKECEEICKIIGKSVITIKSRLSKK